MMVLFLLSFNYSDGLTVSECFLVIEHDSVNISIERAAHWDAAANPSDRIGFGVVGHHIPQIRY